MDTPMTNRNVKAKTINDKPATIKADKPAPVPAKPEAKVYSHKLADGSTVTATECDGGYKLSTDGAVYTSLTAAAQAYLTSKGKKGAVNGRSWFGADGTGAPRRNPNERNVATLADMSKVYEAHPEILKALQVVAGLIAKLPPPPPPAPKTILVTLPDGSKVEVRASAIKK